MFHQANTRDYDGAGHSLLSDLLDAAFNKYAAVMSFPVVSPTMDDLAARVRNRMAFDASGVVATIAGGALTVAVAQAATVPVTGLCTPGAESYGGQTISYLALAAGRSVTYPLDGCSGAGGTGGAPATDGGGDPGGGSSTDGGAGGMPSGTASWAEARRTTSTRTAPPGRRAARARSMQAGSRRM